MTKAPQREHDMPTDAAEPAVSERPKSEAVAAAEAEEPRDTPDHHDVADDETSEAMMPGEFALPGVAVAPDGADAEAVHDQWQAVLVGFIDDPLSATSRARGILSDAIDEHTRSLRDNLERLDGWQSSDSPDTEVLRAAMKGYRDLLAAITGA